MKLYTTVEIPTPKNKIDHDSSIFLIGSCFAENIGRILSQYKLQVFINPCGIAYNPSSVAQSIALTVGADKLNDEDFIFHNNKWSSLQHHGSFSNQIKETLQHNISQKLHVGKSAIRQATHVFITLGTAWIFEHITSKTIVNNCHKLPATEFKRRRLSINDIVKKLQECIKLIRILNASCQIFFTVSPIRHLKDGAHENQLSKASLLLAIDEIIGCNEGIGYFPAYEIVMDELRDYRFYESNLTNINNIGVEYIYDKFIKYYLTEKTQVLLPTFVNIHKAMQHRFENNQSTETKKFAKSVLSKIISIQKQIPNINFDKEQAYLEKISNTPF